MTATTTDDANVSAVATTAPWAADILDFWLNQVGEAGWWKKSDIIDTACARFEALWREKKAQPADAFLGRADEALAAIILFDQLPRNMFRNQAEAFATDALALEIARAAVARGYDIQIGGNGRAFFYMPFQHSENLDDQKMSLQLFEGLSQVQPLDFAREHYQIIARFGRFPHRNAALGRENRPGEAEAIEEGRDW
jgi:uncharacterized protein (DUF924 family)